MAKREKDEEREHRIEMEAIVDPTFRIPHQRLTIFA